MKRFVFNFILAFSSFFLNAQNLFEDLKGESSINIAQGGLIRLNTSDESIKLGYFVETGSDHFDSLRIYTRGGGVTYIDRSYRYFGVDFTGKTNNGVSTIFDGDEFGASGDLNLNYQVLWLEGDSAQHTNILNIKGGYSLGSSINLIDLDVSFQEQIEEKEFSGFRLDVSYNRLFSGEFLFGSLIGFGYVNNLEKLRKIKIIERNSFDDPSSNTTRITEKEISGWQGQYDEFLRMKLYFDLVWLPDFLDNRVAFTTYSRTFIQKQDQTNGGFGVFLSQDGSPTRIVGGLLYEFEDLFNQTNSEKSLLNRGRLGLVAGFNF